jgi:hypothetical protein
MSLKSHDDISLSKDEYQIECEEDERTFTV